MVKKKLLKKIVKVIVKLITIPKNDPQQIYLIANLTSSAFTVFLPAWRANPTAF